MKERYRGICGLLLAAFSLGSTGCGGPSDGARLDPPVPPRPMLAARPTPPAALQAPNIAPWRLETRLPREARRGTLGYRKIGKPYRVAGRLYVPRHDPNYDASGLASWYGGSFEGKLTANGERFRLDALTGAHPTLPLPSYVDVTNLANGKTVRIRLNDRGPFVAGRIIDLSPAAADVLGFRHRGITRVRVRYVGQAPLIGG